MQRIAALTDLQDRLAALLGCARDHRPVVIANMLRRSPQESTGYWLQLLVAVGIATLGLVLGSTAVVIGAMLIAPLMGPIVSFGMGLAVGSPFLVVRSGVRILISVAVAVASSSLLTLALPFHELNAEIASRTTPTVLDLLTAAFCALAGVYAAMRPGSDIASTAAGTSIGISLVPPLCASGFGVGTAAWNVAGGALLLFLTNFVAIVLVGTLAFAAAGFHQVNISRLERDELQKEGDGPVLRSRLDRRLRVLFASRGGPWLRLLMPFMLLGAVYVPLRKGLDEVAWQIGARKEVNTAIERLALRVVQSRVRVERQQIDLTLILVGSTKDADAARQRLEHEIRGATDVTPRLDIFAVADAQTLAGLEAALRAPVLPPAVAQRAPSAQLDDVRHFLNQAVALRWPSRAAGEPLEVSLTTAGERLTLTVVHLGAALDPAAIEGLERALGGDLERAVRVVDAPVPNGELHPTSAGIATVAQLSRWLENSRRTESVSVCVSEPSEPAAPASSAEAPAEYAGSEPLRSVLRQLLESHPRVSFLPGQAWRLRFVVGPCPAAEAPPPAAPQTAPPPAAVAPGKVEEAPARGLPAD
jgi:uncharacterized hydrophobic protein (TIGR00271 family)